MEHPIRTAFCPIFYGANGGLFSSSGLPLVREEYSVEETDHYADRMFVRGLCSRCWDCGSCSLMREWVESLQAQGWVVGWECDDCLKKTRKVDDAAGGRKLPGFYQAGRNSSRDPGDRDYDKDNPGLEGCTRCGHESSFLQLVLRTGG